MANTMTEKSLIEKIVDYIKMKIFNIASAVRVLGSYKEDSEEANKKLASVLGISATKRHQALTNMNDKQYAAYVSGENQKTISPKATYATPTRLNAGSGKSSMRKQSRDERDR